MRYVRFTYLLTYLLIYLLTMPPITSLQVRGHRVSDCPDQARLSVPDTVLDQIQTDLRPIKSSKYFCCIAFNDHVESHHRVKRPSGLVWSRVRTLGPAPTLVYADIAIQSWQLYSLPVRQ